MSEHYGIVRHGQALADLLERTGALLREIDDAGKDVPAGVREAADALRSLVASRRPA